MKNLFRFLPLLLVLPLANARAGEADDFAAVRHADQQRLVATIASDTTTLNALLSDDLRYALSDGRVQTKAQFLAAARENKVKFLSAKAEDVSFQAIASGAVAMSGRTRLSARAGDRRVEFTLHFLALWREENGRWRLLAYQSAQLAEPPGSATK